MNKAEAKHYQVGTDFTISIASPNLGSAEYFVAELTGPVDVDGALETVLKTRGDPGKPHTSDGYILRGPVPKSGHPGYYSLTKLTVYNSLGRTKPRDYPEPPEAWIIIDPYSPGPPPPLPTINRVE
jgi:hypothetical protein